MKNKKLLFCGSAIVPFLFFGILSCGDNKAKSESGKETIEVEAPANIISIAQADSVYNNYTKHRVSVIETYEAEERASEVKFEAARFVSYDLSTIKQYIAFVEQESKKAGVTPNTLRFYFANYPNEDIFPSGKKVVHKKQNTIFILPTLSEKGQDYGFYIGADGKAKLIKDRIAGIMEEGADMMNNKSEASMLPSLKASLYQTQSLILNRGQSGPPPFGDF